MALLDVVMPERSIADLEGSPQFNSGPLGGFRVQFVRRAGGDLGPQSLSHLNPRKAPNPADNTELVQVELLVLNRGGKGKPDLLDLRFMVHPRY